MMKKILTAAFCCVLFAFQMHSQTRDEILEAYTRQVSRLGYAGVGVERIIDRWEAAFPEDGLMMEARYAYWLTKSRSTEVVKLDRPKYLGQKPVLTLPDSTGASVYFFQDNVYQEDAFATALSWIDKAIKLYPDECSYSFDKVSGMVEYEKESPDLALEMLVDMVERHAADRGWWKSDGEVVDGETFSSAIQEYCFKFYSIGSYASYEAFRVLSEEMARLYPANPDFITNIGSYWLIARDNEKKAMTYYKKALKINPEDQTALTNIKVIEKRTAQKKKKK